MATLAAPHKPIKAADEKEKFLVELFDTLWLRYRGRQEYVRKYEGMIQEHHAAFVNDHIAFRTFASQDPAAGHFMISRLIEALGYKSAAAYEFPDKHLSSLHFSHVNPQFPKLFISQLKTWELSPESRKIIFKSLKTHRKPLTDSLLAELSDLKSASPSRRATLLKILVKYFEQLPWDLPQKKDVVTLDKESQFGAWVLVNGYDVNHFTISVNSHGVDSLDDIEKTVEAMKKAGIPMKPEIEGKRGSKLRQSSTESVVVEVPVMDGQKKTKMPWTYAYFEVADRPWLPNPETGKQERFEGFLGGQATNLFEMTKLKQ